MKLLRRPVLDQVATQRTPLLITMRGKPVARLVPVDDAPVTLFGRMAGTIRIVGNIVSSPLDESEWGCGERLPRWQDGLISNLCFFSIPLSGRGKWQAIELSHQSRSAIDEAVISGQLRLFVITLWEIALLASRRRLQLGKPTAGWIADSLVPPGSQVEFR